MKDQLLDEMSKPSVIDLESVEPISEEEFRKADEATHTFDAAQYILDIGINSIENDLNSERIARVPGWLGLYDRLANEGEDSATDYEND